MQMKMESPGALAGATGADLQDWLSWADYNIERTIAATALMNAVLACHPTDRLPLLERMFDAMRPGQPITAFERVMDEASFWADMASRTERKAYLWACHSRLSAGDQEAFLNMVQRKRAA